MKKTHTFERFESKYLLTSNQKDALMALYNDHLVEDAFPHTHIVSVYFDTCDYRVIRESIEAKDYKEKLRLRKYVSDNQSGTLFFEIKRKVDGIVYKRRKGITSLQEIHRIHDSNPKELDQIEHEIQYVFQRNPDLKPSILIGYDRDAYKACDDDTFRLTIDTAIKARFIDVMDLEDTDGDHLLEEGMSLMEVKTRLGYPRWFLDFLNENGVIKQSFSKYGNAFKQKVAQGEIIYG
ncbi:hypothetical protein AOC36_03230 [Erysipelothrix larvae]|uniref:VTC domain-containing protein n=1 Tax=Erysipelothrix larvae TaxID=1514105 RepID=A0A109UGP9_9FIRM|nr:polyphosphate polymerase domain-containing protein [Erysipelothrix larvae]AMC93028.1 hypothetical protein AOC36_03230 [Erysipelothrix larvae]